MDWNNLKIPLYALCGHYLAIAFEVEGFLWQIVSGRRASAGYRRWFERVSDRTRIGPCLRGLVGQKLYIRGRNALGVL